jgi:hypothetical protein
MNVAQYGLRNTGKVCLFCRGKGCSYCNKTGIRQNSEVYIISDELITQQQLMAQQNLKAIGGRIIFEEEEKKDNETKQISPST